MKTDHLFYELFRFSPESLFELVQLEVQGRYRFESITVKHTEKRFDGYFKSEGDDGPDVFLEVQGYPDKSIYIQDNATPLVALKPLALSDWAELPAAIEEWKAGIDAMGLPEDRKERLNGILEYVILQRFKNIPLEEVRKMIQLTPLEEIAAVKELLQQSEEKGVEKGVEKGRLIGKIQLIQLLLQRPSTPEKTLESLPVEDLEAMLAGLEADMAKHGKWRGLSEP